jgi:hypothetical protein
MFRLLFGSILALFASSVQAQQLALLAPAQPAPAAGSVLFVAGDAKAVNGQGVSRRLSRGDIVREGDTLVTGADSQLQLRMTDDALLSVRPESRLHLHMYSFAERGERGSHASMELVMGGLRSITGAIGRVEKQNYILRGGKSLIGVRGTDHETYVSDAGTYNRVTVGGTYLTDERGRVDLDAAETGFAPADGSEPPRRLERAPEFMHLAFQQNATRFTAEMREDGLGDERRLRGGVKLGHVRHGEPDRERHMGRPTLPAQATIGENAVQHGNGHGKGGRCGGPCSSGK